MSYIFLKVICTISALVVTKIHCMIFTFLIFSGSLIDFAFAQNDVIPQDNFIRKIDQLDDLLTITVTATLTGLSIAGATFLGRSFSGEEEETKIHTIQAQKNFIKAFRMFLSCTIFIFGFDFFEVMSSVPSLYVIISDIIITYSLFGLGLNYLRKSAKQIYKMYGK